MSQWREKNITSENVEDALTFCLEYEVHCINLVQYLVEERKNLKRKFPLPITRNKIPLAKAFYLNGKIGAVACINRHQFFLYCAPEQRKKMKEISSSELEMQENELCLLMIRVFPLSKIYALMGEEKIQIKLKENLLARNKIKTTYIMHYTLMVFDQKCFEQKVSNHVFFEEGREHKAHPLFANQDSKQDPLKGTICTRQATTADASSLLTLQIEYEKEEVCIDKKSFPPYISMMNLQKILKDEIAYITILDGLPIAKANTNAQGINCCQLGGVYTMPRYRRHGIGSLTVSALMMHICKNENKKIALFVNIENKAAIAMYKRLKFVDAGRFMISYFK